ncbi:MAG: hypothetical protein HQL18_03140 [Candidatus Omnitrophica bacterium]|nr:hypothetical protein [Candidatus Omnitrophota bacterium]
MGILLCCGTAASAQGPAPVEHPWMLEVNKYGVSVATRRVDKSSILEYRSHVIVDAPLAEVIPFFEDAKSMPLWFHSCRLARLVEDVGPQDKIIYMTIYLSWPVSPRDVVARVVKSGSLESGEVRYMFSALPDRLPADKRFIRMTYLKSLWTFTAMPDGRTEVYFQQHSDPGGFIPKFVVNELVVSIPFQTLQGLRKFVMASRTAAPHR